MVMGKWIAIVAFSKTPCRVNLPQFDCNLHGSYGYAGVWGLYSRTAELDSDLFDDSSWTAKNDVS